MTCDPFERDLALYVEADLPEEAALVLEHHLRDCANCRGFLRSLQESQRWLKVTAADPLAEGEVAVLRRRVLAAAGSGTRGGPARRTLGLVAIAAAVALLVVGAWLHRVSRRVSEPEAMRVVDSARSAGEAAGSPRLAPTPGRPATNTPAFEALAARTRATRASAPRALAATRARAPVSLAPDEADQLARAVVFVSRIDRVPEDPGEPARATDPFESPAETPVVKLFTADPDVVMYFQAEQSDVPAEQSGG